MNISGSYLTINLKNLEHNLKVIKSKLNANCKIIPVVKANGYGSDSIIIAKNFMNWELKESLLLHLMKH